GATRDEWAARFRGRRAALRVQVESVLASQLLRYEPIPAGRLRRCWARTVVGKVPGRAAVFAMYRSRRPEIGRALAGGRRVNAVFARVARAIGADERLDSGEREL